MAITTLTDRAHAGRLLAERLRKYAGHEDVVVPGLPRGGAAFDRSNRVGRAARGRASATKH